MWVTDRDLEIKLPVSLLQVFCPSLPHRLTLTHPTSLHHPPWRLADRKEEIRTYITDRHSTQAMWKSIFGEEGLKPLKSNIKTCFHFYAVRDYYYISNINGPDDFSP